ncbi:MAG: cysteine--tRNA ligase [Chloroflexi bacterium]|nr:cysteine--tRNA ligase [Chloroflexota bacterium]
MTLRIYNTLSRRKEEFQPLGDPVRFYCCGMTPKFHPHLGHAKLFVTMDVIRRYLGEKGYRVRYVQNFTDVDDKIIARGLSEGVSAAAVARRYTDGYFHSMEALNVQPADVYPRVSQTISGIIEMIQGLIAGGNAYAPGNGDVYFRVASFPSYGKLSHRTADDVLAGARVTVGEEKEDPRDFALWKAAKEDEPSWPSPWGAGRPGWHIECSAMSRQELGDQIDIHAGGPDLIFPHHENEIAQSESFTHKEPFARYWVHIGQLNVGSEKMAHSLNNFTTVLETLERHHPVVLRLYYLSQHYRTPVTYTDESLVLARKQAEHLIEGRSALASLIAQPAQDAVKGSSPAPVRELASMASDLSLRFFEAMDDDFNTALALSRLYVFSREAVRVSQMRPIGHDPQAQHEALRLALTTFDHLVSILGFDLPRSSVELVRGERALALDAATIEAAIARRAELRRQRKWSEADAIREQLLTQGIVLEDGSHGTTWRRA